MALPAGRYGVTKNQLLKIKKLPMNTIKLIEEIQEELDTFGTAVTHDSTSVVTDSSDLVESEAVKDIVGWGNKNKAKSYQVEPYTEQYYRALNIEFDIQPNTEYTFSFDAPSGNKYYFNNSLFVQAKEVTTDGTRKATTVTTKSTIDNTQHNVNGWFILKNSLAQPSAPSFSNVMITDADVTNVTYEPYHESVEETLRDAEVIEGKNLLPVTLKGLKELNTRGAWSGNTYTLNNVDFTVETDGDKVVGIDVNGTANADVLTQLLLALPLGGDILTGCPTGGGWNSYVLYQTNGVVDSGEGATGILTNNYVCIYVKTGYNVQHKKFYPMIRKASVTDATYEPYYTPLKDVVPNKVDNSVIAPVENGPTASQAYAVNDVFIRNGALCKVTSAISQGDTLSNQFTVTNVGAILTALLNA